MHKFQISQAETIQNYYETNGYVVIEKLLPDERIDAFLSAYSRIKNNPFFVSYSQSIHRAIRIELTSEGFIRESMLNPSRLKFFPGFARSLEKCLFHQNISEALSLLSDAEEHVLWQNMFFDFSPGTIEHQDHWYLDTDPPGHLIAAWYALEDIHPDSGCFFVLPGSHRGEVLRPESFPSHESFRLATLSTIQKSSYEYETLVLKKGDVLLWHPYTIHGAHSNADPRYSRKSFTAHFYPASMQGKGGHGRQRKSTSDNPKVLTAYGNSDMAWSLKNYLMYFRDSLTRNRAAIMDMRRKSYTKDSVSSRV